MLEALLYRPTWDDVDPTLAVSIDTWERLGDAIFKTVMFHEPSPWPIGHERASRVQSTSNCEHVSPGSRTSWLGVRLRRPCRRFKRRELRLAGCWLKQFDEVTGRVDQQDL